MKKTIEVTQEDIDKGIRVSAAWCPISRAARRAFGVECSVARSSGIHVFYGRSKGDVKLYSLDAEAMAFIKLFDHEYNVHPFTFETEEIYV